MRTLGCLASILLLTVHVAAGDWPCWRGPTGQGHSDEKDLPLTWGGPTNANVLWKVALPGADGQNKLDHNQASPIVSGERVFVSMVYWPAGVSQKEMPQHRVACYEAADGKQLWDTAVPPGPWLLTDLRGGYNASTPAADGERVYVLFGSSVLAALSLEGKLVWRQDITPYAWDVRIGTSPVLYRDTVLVLADGTKSAQSRLLAFDKKTGALRWEQKRPTSSFSHSTPLLVQVQGQPQLLVSASGAVQGLDPADGKLLWWCRNPGDVTTPVFGQGLVYSDSGRGGPGVAVAPTGNGDVTQTHLKWQTPKIPEGLYSSPIVVGDYLYRTHAPGLLKCQKLTTGEVLYDERLPPGLPGHISPLTTADGRIYLASAGKSAVLEAGPTFKVLAVNDLGDASAASPAAAHGRLFLKGARFLYCLGTPK